MGYKFVKEENAWTAWHSERHPITRIPKMLRRKGLKSEAEAKRVERNLVVEVRVYFSETSVPTWPKLVAEYTEAKLIGDWTEKTFQNCKICLEAHTFENWKSRRIDMVTPKEVRDLITERVGHTSTGNQANLLKFIRGTFQFAVDEGYLVKNPAPNVRFKVGEKIKKVLTLEQTRTLLEKAKAYNSEWYYHWTLALYTGLRNGELFALTWDKINFENRTMLVDSSWNKFDGFKDTKSGDDRIVEVAPTLMTVLKELKLKQFDSHFVLPRSRNWEKGEQARMLRMFLQGIGLPEVRFHDLRATWATIMLSRGIEPIKVMSMGGWKNLKTMQIYIRKAGVNIKGITNTLELHNPSLTEAKLIQISGFSHGQS
jgi:integrase